MPFTIGLGYFLLLSSLRIVPGLDVDQGHYPVIYTRRFEDELPFDIVQEPIPPECNLQPHTDYDGAAIRWGHKPAPPVFCEDPSGECWSPDIWPHETGECWLKHQQDWNGDPATLVENGRGDYPQEWLKLHSTSPSRVPWTAGYRTV